MRLSWRHICISTATFIWRMLGKNPAFAAACLPLNLWMINRQKLIIFETRGQSRRGSHLVFHGDRVPGHVDAFDRSKRSKGLSDGVLPQLVVDGADVNSTHDGQSSLTLSCYLNTTRTQVTELKQKHHNDTGTVWSWCGLNSAHWHGWTLSVSYSVCQWRSGGRQRTNQSIHVLWEELDGFQRLEFKQLYLQTAEETERRPDPSTETPSERQTDIQTDSWVSTTSWKLSLPALSLDADDAFRSHVVDDGNRSEINGLELADFAAGNRSLDVLLWTSSSVYRRMSLTF